MRPHTTGHGKQTATAHRPRPTAGGPAGAGLLMLPQVAGIVVTTAVSRPVIEPTARYRPWLLPGPSLMIVGLLRLSSFQRRLHPQQARPPRDGSAAAPSVVFTAGAPLSVLGLAAAQATADRTLRAGVTPGAGE